MAEAIISQIGRLLPRDKVRKIGRLVSNAGIDINDETAAGLAILIPIIVFVVSAIVLALVNIQSISTVQIDPAVVPIIVVIAALGVSLIAVGAIYEVLLLNIDNRRKEVENVLPDYLQLAAANIRAGMQLDKALWYAAKPEFGILSKEVELASKRVFSGETVEDALTKMADRFQSRYLTRTVDLIREGVVSGGEMAGMLEKTAIDLRNMQLMQKEISASMIMYTIFIAFAAAIGAPFLYVVSYKLLGLFEQVRMNMPVDTGTLSLIRVKGTSIGITSAEFAMFSLGMVIITGVIACMIMATIQTGKKRNAIKYVLPFLLVALAVFYIGSYLLDRFFGAFIF
ncbi:MAG: type II secretion system F family protein, partial [Candidatus Micrarchaeia archaeon]